MECKVWSAKCGVWSGEYGVWSVKCGVESVECKGWNAWNVKCGVSESATLATQNDMTTSSGTSTSASGQSCTSHM